MAWHSPLSAIKWMYKMNVKCESTANFVWTLDLERYGWQMQMAYCKVWRTLDYLFIVFYLPPAAASSSSSSSFPHPYLLIYLSPLWSYSLLLLLDLYLHLHIRVCCCWLCWTFLAVFALFCVFSFLFNLSLSLLLRLLIPNLAQRPPLLLQLVGT